MGPLFGALSQNNCLVARPVENRKIYAKCTDSVFFIKNILHLRVFDSHSGPQDLRKRLPLYVGLLSLAAKPNGSRARHLIRCYE